MELVLHDEVRRRVSGSAIEDMGGVVPPRHTGELVSGADQEARSARVDIVVHDPGGQARREGTPSVLAGDDQPWILTRDPVVAVVERNPAPRAPMQLDRVPCFDGNTA